MNVLKVGLSEEDESSKTFQVHKFKTSNHLKPSYQSAFGGKIPHTEMLTSVSMYMGFPIMC